MQHTNTDTLYLGIDGGGSTCKARLRDGRGQLLGSGASGPANLRLGFDQVCDEILRCTHQALAQAGLVDYPLAKLHVGIGLAGAVVQAEKQSTVRLQQQFARCFLHQDAYIACLGAHLGEPGGIVIVGTGSCAQIITPSENRTYGGWGFALSDHASGAHLGRSAIRQALHFLEGMRPSSALCIDICKHFDNKPEEMLRWSDTAIPADYANFAPRVFEHADNKDSIARKIIENACNDLQKLISCLEKHKTGKISLVGGLASNYLRYLPSSTLDTLCPARSDAMDGALIMAGLPITALGKQVCT